MTLLPPLLFLSQAMVRQGPSLPTRAASLSSELWCCQHTIQSISLFKHCNDRKSLPGEKTPCSQPASFHPSLFLVQLGLSQEGVGQIPPRTAEFAILLSLLSVTVRGLLEGGIRLRSLQLSALWVLCIMAGCWLPTKDSFTSLLGVGKGVVRNIMGFPQA